ncbi:MAG: hypothetical protein AB1416_02475 [Actinomycetota bacterium]
MRGVTVGARHPGRRGTGRGEESMSAGNIVELSEPGRVVIAVERCMRKRIAPRRSGWSTCAHLGRDLERDFGVRVPEAALERALMTLVRRHRVGMKTDERGVLWFRVRD